MMTVAVVKSYDKNAIARAMELAEKYDGFKVNGLFASDMILLQKEEPALYEKVELLISQGRWNPCVGMWKAGNGWMSEEALCRNILYSVDFFKEEYHVFYASDYYNASLAKCAYAGRFDAVINEKAENNHWLKCSDGSRVLVLSPVCFKDVLSLDENEAAENEFVTFEEYSKAVLSTPLELPVTDAGVEETIYTENEKKLLDCERAAAQQKTDVREKIKSLWLCGGTVAEAQVVENVKIDVPGVQLVSFKLSEDGTGDTVLRVRETSGRETPVRLICDDIEAAFRFEIMPFETITFRVDKEGFVTETFIQE